MFRYFKVAAKQCSLLSCQLLVYNDIDDLMSDATMSQQTLHAFSLATHVMPINNARDAWIWGKI